MSGNSNGYHAEEFISLGLDINSSFSLNFHEIPSVVCLFEENFDYTE